MEQSAEPPRPRETIGRGDIERPSSRTIYQGSLDFFLRLIRRINRVYGPLTIRLQVERLIVCRQISSSPRIKYLMRLFSLDWFIAHEIFAQEVYHVSVRPGDEVIDGGAHIGMFSLYCASRGAATCYSFEPSEENLPILRANVGMNHYEDRVRVVDAAIWSHGSEGEQLLFTSRNSGNNSLIPFYAGARARRVKTVALAEYLPCDVLKLDVEGAEYEIMESLDLSKVRREIAIEFHLQGDLSERLPLLLLRIRSAGFQIDFMQRNGINGYLHAKRE